MSEVQGVVAVLTGPDGHVWASVADFDRSGYGGFTQQEAQKMRANRTLAREFIDKTCSQIVVDVLDAHRCQEIVSQLCQTKGFKQTLLPVGYPKEDE